MRHSAKPSPTAFGSKTPTIPQNTSATTPVNAPLASSPPKTMSMSSLATLPLTPIMMPANSNA